ncbi:uncharacterized protein LOC141907910 [Tubulanus polymorphus]|uniref:uncharacterized protein LOC141907910 n=1 Tax=Tubulanus polymorphus TaxID=672921 RepID=UPI003DA4C48B
MTIISRISVKPENYFASTSKGYTSRQRAVRSINRQRNSTASSTKEQPVDRPVKKPSQLHEPSSRPSLQLILSVLVWFICDMSTSNLNKFVYTRYNFPYPFSFTCIQVLITIAMTTVLLHLTPMSKHMKSAGKISSKTIWKLVLLGGASCFGNVFGKMATKTITVTLLKTVTAARPAVTLLLSALITGRHGNGLMKMALFPVCAGTIMCVCGDMNFHIVGVLAAIGAVTMRSLKSLLQGILLADDKIPSILLLYRVSFPSLAIISTTVLFKEPAALTDTATFSNVELLGVLVLTGILGATTNLVVMMVTSMTNYMTQSVLSNVVIIMNILASVILFRNPLTPVSAFGICIVFSGVILYNYGNRIYKSKSSR